VSEKGGFGRFHARAYLSEAMSPVKLQNRGGAVGRRRHPDSRSSARLLLGIWFYETRESNIIRASIEVGSGLLHSTKRPIYVFIVLESKEVLDTVVVCPVHTKTIGPLPCQARSRRRTR
jgi:hypothetical protein